MIGDNIGTFVGIDIGMLVGKNIVIIVGILVDKEVGIFGDDNVGRILGNKFGMLVDDDVSWNWGWMMSWKNAAKNRVWLGLLLGEEEDSLLCAELGMDDGVVLVEGDNIELSFLLGKKEEVFLGYVLSKNNKKLAGSKIGLLFGDEDGTLLCDVDGIELSSLFGDERGSEIGFLVGAED